jgi:hypothetical protein
MPAMRALIVTAALAHPAVAEPDFCSTWQQITTCAGPGGYVGHETTWQGLTTGADNQGNRWTTSRWRDITTVAPPDR